MDNKTDANAEAMTSNHMTDMCPMDARALLNAITMWEQNKGALYTVLAQCAPTPCLRRMTTQMAAENHAATLNDIAAAYGIGVAMPITPGNPPPMKHPFMPPSFFAAAENNEEE
ncbi:MAG: hypothetical protein PHP51_01165 [Desulfotomaculaceae bacterium]|nr:hypothetical protein [Desulfotomaculaceae bacterium]MDD4766985.1 hypothetical protein [Desulfotomaculaceae bacterium]